MSVIPASAPLQQTGASTFDGQAEAVHWSQQLQRRIMRLLLQHDHGLFRGQFRSFYTCSSLPEIPLLRQYDRYIRLCTLGDELLDDIMPRIRRQLSLQTSQVRLQEEAPTRGDIDWRRTIERSWRETPSLAPLVFDTRLRQRTHATPENVLVVAILLAFQHMVGQVQREAFADEALSDVECQVLTSANDRVTRELAAAYARALLGAARQWQGNIAGLADQVAPTLRPGPNPYKDLIAWWRRWSTLRVGRNAVDPALTVASQRNDEKADAWLYELWIVLELVHYLQQQQALRPADTSVQPDMLQFTFGWGNRRFRFRHNRQGDESGTQPDSIWEQAPGSRPDYTIEREQPLEWRHEQTLIWREPPVIMDAKYYLRGADPARTHEPIKKLLGDTVLLNARHCILFFPRLADPPRGSQVTRTVQLKAQRHGGGLPRDLQVALVKLAPTLPIPDLQGRLHAVLDQAVATLPERPTIACHGVWLDPDTHHAAVSPSMQGIICPKPHIGPDIYDLVDVTTDCLKNPLVCHVIGQPIVPPLVIRVTSQAELQQQTHDIRSQRDYDLHQAEDSQQGDRAEQLRQHILTGVGRTIGQYVKLRGNTAAIEETFERWVFGDFWKAHNRALASDVRDMLLSGEYIWQEYQQTNMADWAAPAIQYCRALEREIKRRFCDANYKQTYKVSGAGWTPGTPLHAYRHHTTNANAQQNWHAMNSVVQHNGSNPQQFQTVMQQLDMQGIGTLRNRLAHGEAIPRSVAETIRTLVIGSRSQPGVLLWFAEHLNVLML